MQKLFLIRHGVTELNEQRRYCGVSDEELSEHGVLQVQLAGQLFGQSNISSVFTSPLKRCLETSNAISLPEDIRTESLAGLREIDFGLWEGLTFDEIQTSYPGQMNGWFENPDEFTFPAGESVFDFRKRVLLSLEDVLKQQGNILIVAHGGSLRVIICHLCGWGSQNFHSFVLDHASLTILDHYDESTVVKMLNDTCHLKNGRAI